jgi:hypothetical protein
MKPARPVLPSFLLVCLALVALAAGPAAARDGRKSLRKEVEGLKAQITELRLQVGQLQSALATERQRFAGDGAVSVPGGTGICADPCAADSDGDGLGDCEDPCLCDPQQSDRDGDGTPDCLDPCPDEADDACIDPCRWDSDGDRTNDCEDPCPWDPLPPEDRDGNGVPDCLDICWLIAEPVAADGSLIDPTSPLPCPILFRMENAGP